MIHLPVLLEETLEVLKPRRGRVIVDATLGLGGHARAFLERGAKVIGLDLDPAARATNVELHHANFAALPSILAGRRVDGVLADLGLASPQIDDPERGFSYRRPGPLDMRMDPTRGEPAWAMLEHMKEEEVAQALLELGDETDAPGIAKLIVRRPPRTTQELTSIICEVRHFTPQRARGAKLHPAARTFQAIRMLVNRELPNLERLLAVLPSCLKPGGVAAIISFHSGEDRLVKKAFRSEAWSETNRRPIVPSPDEMGRNPRSRSAKLRWARTPRAKNPLRTNSP